MIRHAASVLFALSLASQALAQQTTTESIMGGFTTLGDAYGALVTSGPTLSPLSLGFTTGQIASVSMNDSLKSIIGGTAIADAYAAFVSSGGAITPLTLPGIASGIISSVAINTGGQAIIGGVDTSMATAYAAVVSAGGTVTQLTSVTFAGSIGTVAINDGGRGIIGGSDSSMSPSAYAALVFPDKTVSANLMTHDGVIRGVGINNGGYAIVGGGVKQTMITPPLTYAAIVYPDQTVTANLLGFAGGINSAAINNAGHAIVGGNTGSMMVFTPYAALIDTSGNITDLQPQLPAATSATARIDSVAINSSSAGIIGGIDGTGLAYAAFVSPGAIVQSLNLPFSGEILSVAINDAQAAIIGGLDSGTGAAYAALVAPNGTVTPLNLGFNGTIDSVDIGLLTEVTPTSVGPYGSVYNSVLAASFALQSHINMNHKQLWKPKENENEKISLASEPEFLATPQLAIGSGFLSRRKLTAKAEKPKDIQPSRVFEPKSRPHYNVWVAPFYDFMRLKERGPIPAFTNQIGGVVAAAEYMTARNDVFGGGLAYAFNYTHYSKSLGHSKINEEMGVVYGSFQRGRIFVNATVWGGLYQLKNKRHTGIPSITATGKTHGWILSPHMELSGIAYRNDANWFAVEPFIMEDWVNFWQKHYTEKGASGFNLKVPHRYSSLLRSEAGVRFYEQLAYNWGDILIEEKASYINQKAFHVGSATTAFVGAVSNFSVAVDSPRAQNLGGVELACSFFPKNTKYPYGSINFQGEFGSTLQSYFAGFEIGKRF